jgi:hypothetical protein
MKTLLLLMLAGAAGAAATVPDMRLGFYNLSAITIPDAVDPNSITWVFDNHTLDLIVGFSNIASPLNISFTMTQSPIVLHYEAMLIKLENSTRPGTFSLTGSGLFTRQFSLDLPGSSPAESGDVRFTSALPEPGTFAAAAIAIGLILVRARSRRARS